MGTMSKVYILHGWTYSVDKWEPFIKLLQEKGLAPQLLKIPGLTEKISGIWRLETYVDWLKKKVGGEKVILIGHSNGGRISLAFSLKYPEKVEHLVLVDSAGIYHNELPIRLKRFLFKTVAKIGRKITKSETMRKILYKLSRESDYEKASPRVRKTMANLITTDMKNQLHQIKTPTLIIWGEDDRVTPLADGIVMHKLIRGSEMKIINGARHSPQFTHPERVVKIIYEYL